MYVFIYWLGLFFFNYVELKIKFTRKIESNDTSRIKVSRTLGKEKKDMHLGRLCRLTTLTRYINIGKKRVTTLKNKILFCNPQAEKAWVIEIDKNAASSRNCAALQSEERIQLQQRRELSSWQRLHTIHFGGSKHTDPLLWQQSAILHNRIIAVCSNLFNFFSSVCW